MKRQQRRLHEATSTANKATTTTNTAISKVLEEWDAKEQNLRRIARADNTETRPDLKEELDQLTLDARDPMLRNSHSQCIQERLS